MATPVVTRVAAMVVLLLANALGDLGSWVAGVFGRIAIYWLVLARALKTLTQAFRAYAAAAPAKKSISSWLTRSASS